MFKFKKPLLMINIMQEIQTKHVFTIRFDKLNFFNLKNINYNNIYKYICIYIKINIKNMFIYLQSLLLRNYKINCFLYIN